MDKNAFIESIIKRLTLKEKVSQMAQISYISVPKEQSEEFAKSGVGSFIHVMDPEEIKRLQKLAVENGPKIPIIFGIDAIHGYCLNRKATIFPTQLSMACSFNRELIEQMASATAKEVSADNQHWTFSPVFCLGRDTRWGRVPETFGEDKYLSGELGVAMIKGYQGDDMSQKGKIAACAKHYIGYGESKGGRDSYDTQISYRKVKNDLLPPFEKAVKAGCATVMSAYGSIDGTPCSGNKKLLRDILKDELNFNGFVITDWDNVDNMVEYQHYAESFYDSSKVAIESGDDMLMKTEAFIRNAVWLVEHGQVKEELIDEAVRRVLGVKYDLGLFEDPYKSYDKKILGCKEHQEINKKLADECVVLLKNDGILPLSLKNGKYKNILVVGEYADDARDMLGDWTYFTHPEPDFNRSPSRPYTTFIEGMKNVCGDDINVDFAKGCVFGNEKNYEKYQAEAMKKAEKADLIVFVPGDTLYRTGAGLDLADCKLTDDQYRLFDKLCGLNKEIISVYMASRPLIVNDIVKKSSAFLTGFNLGQHGGQVLAETLFGKLNPSGKLPISFPLSTGQLPVYYNYLPGWHPDTYIDLPKEPLFSFGEGLSYTKFEYDNLKFDVDSLTLTVDVKNTGKIKGKEIVEVYFRDLESSVITPVKQLIGFEKIELCEGEKKTCVFKFTKDDLSFVNNEEQRVFESGGFMFMAGRSSKDCDLLKTSVYIK